MRLRPIPALQDNYIWLIDDGVDAIAVDPGIAKPLLDELANHRLRLTSILLTHHHLDHVGGVAELLRCYPSAKVFAPRDARIEDAAHEVGEGDTVFINSPGIVFEVLEIPGHTSTHIAFFGGGMLFCGDTLFSLGCGRMFEGTPAQFHNSLARMAALPGSTRVCCGHEYTIANAQFAMALDPLNAALGKRVGEVTRLRAASQSTLPSCIDDERAANPFLRCETPAIVDALTQRHQRAPRDDIEAFAWLRAWKDTFRVSVA